MDPTESKSSWFKELQISEQPVAYMPYQQFRITIFKSSGQSSLPNQFFYSPISLLNPESTLSSFDQVSQQAEVRFQIAFWSTDIENCAIHYLQEIYNNDIKTFNIQLIPFDQVLLSSNTYSKTYHVISDWTPYQLKTSMWFSVLCSSATEAVDLAKEIRTKPEHCCLLKSLRIKFGLSTLEQPQRKKILIHPENIRSTQIFHKINRRFPLTNSVIVTAADFSTLLSQSVREVIHSNFKSNDVLDPTSIATILSTVELMLHAKKKRMEGNFSVWNSVFWLDEDLRPDRAAESINEFYNELDEEAQNRMKDELKRSIFSPKKWTRDEKLLKIFTSNRSTFEWNGRHFVPSFNSTLFKIKLSSDPNKYTTGNVMTQFTSASWTMAIELRDSGADFIVQKDTLMEEINILKAQIKDFSDSSSKIQKRLLGVESQLRHLNKSEFYFVAHRKSSFDQIGKSVGFEGMEVNLGTSSAILPMNIDSGTFTAPKSGLYLFNFTAYPTSMMGSTVQLTCNELVKETATANNGCVFLIRILDLKMDDYVSIRLLKGCLKGSSSDLYTRFSGILLYK